METHEEDYTLTREQIKVWRCECGAGPEAILWTETVSFERKWDGERFVSVDEDLNDVEFTCTKCGAAVPRPEDDLINEAINN
jgi:hypothetical protein